MRFKIEENKFLSVYVEEFFTLIDYMLLMACFLIGYFFSTIVWIFGFAVFLKLFIGYEFIFNTDTYKIEQYLRLFSYFRFQVRIIPFQEINNITFTDYNSENALSEKGFNKNLFYTIDVVTPNKVVHICKANKEEMQTALDLYNQLEEKLSLYFKFRFELINTNYDDFD